MTEDSASSTQLTPPPGGFQEIDGRRIFVYRSGSGAPVVVLVPDVYPGHQ
jgi:hypothetical protein